MPTAAFSHIDQCVWAFQRFSAPSRSLGRVLGTLTRRSAWTSRWQLGGDPGGSTGALLASATPGRWDLVVDLRTLGCERGACRGNPLCGWIALCNTTRYVLSTEKSTTAQRARQPMWNSRRDVGVAPVAVQSGSSYSQGDPKLNKLESGKQREQQQQVMNLLGYSRRCQLALSDQHPLSSCAVGHAK